MADISDNTPNHRRLRIAYYLLLITGIQVGEFRTRKSQHLRTSKTHVLDAHVLVEQKMDFQNMQYISVKKENQY